MIWKQIRLNTKAKYKAALAMDQNTGVVSMYDEKVWRIRHAIKVLTESECLKS